MHGYVRDYARSVSGPEEYEVNHPLPRKAVESIGARFVRSGKYIHSPGRKLALVSFQEVRAEVVLFMRPDPDIG